MAGIKLGSVGDYIREQRSVAQYSLRQLASAAGVSNPYLSQIERGLRRPSAEILQQIARALRISAETLYVRAGILDDAGDGTMSDAAVAIMSDVALTERQKRVLVEIYDSFRKENDLIRERERVAAGGDPAADQADGSAPTAPTAPTSGNPTGADPDPGTAAGSRHRNPSTGEAR